MTEVEDGNDFQGGKKDENKKSMSSIFKSSYDDPFYLSPHDFASPAKDFVSEPLNSTNYHAWSRSILRALEARNKTGFVDGSIRSPEPGDSRYQAWKRINSLLISWLLSGCNTKISNVSTLAITAHGFWEELKKKYSPRSGTRLLELKREQMSLLQGSMTVLDYYNKLEVISQELNLQRQRHSCTCGGQQSVIDFQEEEFVLQFLIGLNDSYNAQKSQISMMVPLPDKESAFNLISNEEKFRTISQSSYQTTALATNQHQRNPRQTTSFKANSSGAGKGKKKLYCTNCKGTNHDIDHCFHLIGWPDDWGTSKATSKNPGKGHQVHCAEKTIPLAGTSNLDLQAAKDQCFQLMKLLGIQNNEPVRSLEPIAANVTSVSGAQHFEDTWNGEYSVGDSD